MQETPGSARAYELHLLSEGMAKVASAIEACCSQARIPLRLSDDPQLRRDGILLSSSATDAVKQCLKEASSNGFRILLVTRHELSAEQRLSALAAGAADALSWDGGEVPEAISARLGRWRDIDDVVELKAKPILKGSCSAWVGILRRIVEACLPSCVELPRADMLITGETGTGKEMVARFIHGLVEEEEQGRFEVLDCTTIEPGLAGSELFGHEKGAFTGALYRRDGAFAMADGGTLFLDEVGDVSRHLQAKLLRVLQDHSYKPVGSDTRYRANFRLVCATNRDLRKLVDGGRFRRDLYYRIAGACFELPPLSRRGSDIVELAEYFAREYRPECSPVLSEELAQYLQDREYRGNVRELKLLVTHILRRHVGPGPLAIGDLPEEELRNPEQERARRRPAGDGHNGDWRSDPALYGVMARAASEGSNLDDAHRATDRALIAETLRLCGDDWNAVSKRLGRCDKVLRQRLREHGGNGHKDQVLPAD